MTFLKRIAALVLPLAAAVGCESRVDDQMEANATAERMDSITSATPKAIEAVTPAGESNRIAATLEEWRINVPQTLAPGTYTFEVTNGGQYSHALEVEGASQEWETEPVPPGGTATLTVELTPGTWTIYCPVNDDHGKHEELGMRTTILVR